MICPNCGNNVPENCGFCTYCGKAVGQAPPQVQYAPPQNQYTPPYTPPQYTPQYAPPNASPSRDETVTIGEWFGFLVLMCIPICNIIMMFVWAFNPKIKRSKANLCKLQLILLAISLGLFLTIGLILLAVTGSFYSRYW